MITAPIIVGAVGGTTAHRTSVCAVIGQFTQQELRWVAFDLVNDGRLGVENTSVGHSDGAMAEGGQPFLEQEVRSKSSAEVHDDRR